MPTGPESNCAPGTARPQAAASCSRRPRRAQARSSSTFNTFRVFNRIIQGVISRILLSEEAHRSLLQEACAWWEEAGGPWLAAAGLGLAAHVWDQAVQTARAGSPGRPPAVSSWDPRADRGWATGMLGSKISQEAPRHSFLALGGWAFPRGSRGPTPGLRQVPPGTASGLQTLGGSPLDRKRPHLINRLNRGHKPGTQAATSAGEGGAEGRRAARPLPRGHQAGPAVPAKQMRGLAGRPAGVLWGPGLRPGAAHS